MYQIHPAVASSATQAHSPHPRMRHRAMGVGIVSALTLLGFGLGASPALAHDQLVAQSVVTNSNDDSVSGVKLSFNNDILEVGSEISVTDATGKSAADGAPVVSGRDVIQSVTQPASAGEYSVDWRVVSSDGHPIQGTLTLTVDSHGVGTITQAEAEGDHHDDDHADADHADHDATDHDATDHEHGSDEAVTSSSADANENNALVTTAVVVLVVLVAAGAATALVVGGRRRRAAMNQAIDEARENGTDKQ